jgi:hypothetical protein
VIIAGIAVVKNASEQSFCSRTITSSPRLLFHWHQVLGPREDKGISFILISRYALGSRTANSRNTQTPTQAEWAIAVPSAINEVQLGLETVRAGGKADGTVKFTVTVGI